MRWMKYKRLYFAVSFIVIFISAFALYFWDLKLGVDFKGGSVLEVSLSKEVTTEEISSSLKEQGVEISSVQATGQNSYLLKLGNIGGEEKEKVKGVLEKVQGEGKVRELRFERVGPSIGPELIRKTVYGLGIAAVAILLWITYQFKSIKYGLSAVLATLHDTFILIGSFAILGKLFNAEVDFLFVTALLTTLSFSVHDTIVVYDRIRENRRKEGGTITEIADRAITETMVRSLNNSFTIIFMLTALVLLGGTTIKWFAVALLIGTVLGTYSSPFVAVPLLVLWEGLEKKVRK